LSAAARSGAVSASVLEVEDDDVEGEGGHRRRV
jgi:hypothetical protein